MIRLKCGNAAIHTFSDTGDEHTFLAFLVQFTKTEGRERLEKLPTLTNITTNNMTYVTHISFAKPSYVYAIVQSDILT